MDDQEDILDLQIIQRISTGCRLYSRDAMASFFKSIPIFGRDSALRQWLQSLTTGEAGFMNVCVGSTAFTFAAVLRYAL